MYIKQSLGALKKLKSASSPSNLFVARICGGNETQRKEERKI